MSDNDDTVITPPPDPSETPTGFQRLPGGALRWQPLCAEHLQRLLPQYEIHGLLGFGGMGAVYKGRQKSLDRTVAIKVLPPEMDDEDGGFARRFKNEAKLMARLSHPAIVAVHDFGETSEGQLFFIMEFVNGTDVARIIQAQGRMPADHALAVAAHVCDALGFAHNRGIIHRDIKPANVLIDSEGAVKVADFGLAKLHGNANTTGLTQTGMAMGSPDYVAPEAITPGMQADARADLYSLGVMLYHMLTGEVPRGMFDMPSRKMADIDPRFDAIIAKAMKHNREERYQSSDELRRDLDALIARPAELSELAVANAGATVRWRAPVRQYRSSRRLGILVVAALVLVLAAGGYVLFTKPAFLPDSPSKAVANPAIMNIEAKMKRIILPEVKLSRASFSEAFMLLQKQSRELDSDELDPSKKGINIILNGSWGFYATRVTAELQAVTLEDAVRYVADRADLKVSLEEHGVLLIPKVQERLQKIIIPDIKFHFASLEEVLKRLEEESAKHDHTENDPAKKGVKISLYSSAEAREHQISLVRKNASLDDILTQCSWQARQVIEFSDHGVIVTSRTGSKLKRIILPVVTLKGASTHLAVEQLRILGKQADTAEENPAEKGVNITLKTNSAQDENKITLDLREVPLGVAIDYVAQLSGMKMTVESDAVVVSPLGAADGK